MIFLESVYRFFCSIKLAVCLLVTLIVLFAIGTIYESLYSRLVAQEIIYQSYGMLIAIFLLAVNITAVMIDRWPWKKKHTGFLLAHFGILFVITGALLTRYYGVDGHLRLKVGESSHQIMTSDILLGVYSSFSGQNLTELHREKVHFFKDSPSEKHPHTIFLGNLVLNVVDFYPVATARVEYQPVQKNMVFSHQSGVAVRFQIEGTHQVVSWLFKPVKDKTARQILGPAQVVLLDSLSPEPSSYLQSKGKTSLVDRPTLLLAPAGSKKLAYQLHHPSQKKIIRGMLSVGSVLKTGWMDLKFRLLSYWPQALPSVVYTPRQRAGSNTTSAIQVSFRGDKKWMGLNSHLFFFDKDKVFVVAYVNDKRDLNFNIKLSDFKINRYPSSIKPASYESQVLVSPRNKKAVQKSSMGGVGPKPEESYLISMNDPLKRGGYTIYQSGFEEDDKGRPLASIFSVNRDPGRLLKYLGSILVVLGSLVLFIRKKMSKFIN